VFESSTRHGFSHFPELLQNLTRVVFTTIGDVRVDSEASTVTSSISRICEFSLLKVLIGVGSRTCIYYLNTIVLKEATVFTEK
jgi:hypothetical protein